MLYKQNSIKARHLVGGLSGMAVDMEESILKCLLREGFV